MDGPVIVIVEDDERLRALLLRGLLREGFAAEGARTGAEVLRRIDRRSPDALVLDVRLPDADGRDLCQAIRARGEDAPVVFMSGYDALSDRLAGFSAGGDDYIAKPFALDELVARLRAVLRRAAGKRGMHVAGLRFDPSEHSAFAGDTRLDLTPTEFRLLASLCSAAGHTVPRRELLRAAWPHGAMVSENTLDAYIARLRRKLRRAQDAPVIATRRGVGYTLVAAEPAVTPAG